MGICIDAVELYHGDKVVTNYEYIRHFKEQGKDINHFFKNVMGRDKRFMLDIEKEPTTSMAVTVAKKLLSDNNISKEDIGLIIFSSILPEYVAPPSSVIIHRELDLGTNVRCYDLNGNCAGMLLGLSNAYEYLQYNRGKKVLLLGCDDVDSLADTDNELCYGHFGHASCGVILSYSKDDTFDSRIITNSEESSNIRFPYDGFAKVLYRGDTESLKMKWLPFDGSNVTNFAIKEIKELLCGNNLGLDDIKMFCLSQFAYANIEIIRDKLAIPVEKSLYVGDIYGYTGTTSPFLVLYTAIKQKRIKRGDYIIFWTVGAGSQSIATLMKY